ncbi:VOC family protein, partial [Streptomyces monticola]
MLTRIDHIGIACHDLEKTVEFYTSTYGFEVFHTEVNEE